MDVEAALRIANRSLEARGFASHEARVDPAPEVGAECGRLHGSLLSEEHAGPIGEMLRLVALMPDRETIVGLDI